MKRSLDQIIRERGDEILQKKNVVGLGSGKKNKTNKKSIVVLVQKKEDKDKVSKDDLIPTEIDGQITDVIEVGDLTASSLAKPNKKRERPIYGGISAIWEKGTACTLGAVVFRDGKKYALMNTHCVNPHWKGALIGDEVLQPSPNDRGKSRDRIGVSTADFEELKFNGTLNDFDAGLCALDDDIEVKELYQENAGKITDTPKDVKAGDLVRKSGRTTGYTETKVLLTNATVVVNYDGNKAKFHGQVIVENKDRHFGDGGDSSSLVLDKENNPVGLYFAGSQTIGIFSPIQPILDKYRISFSSKPKKVEEIVKEQFIFNKTLKKGDYSEDVRQLQKRLRSEGFFTYPTNTGYYGAITENAVKRYQCANDIVCNGTPETTGWGVVGPKTRKTLNDGVHQTEIETLVPLVRIMAEKLIETMGIFGYKVFIHDAYRSMEEQQELYDKGRKTAGKIVTYAPPGFSFHQYRVAFDVVFVDEDGNASWSNEYPWDKLGRVGEILGLEWGGRWNNPDRPHFQYTGGRSIEDFINDNK